MNELVITTEDGIFIFVTRDGTEPFTLEEAKRHIGERANLQLSFPNKPIIPNRDAEFSAPRGKPNKFESEVLQELPRPPGDEYYWRIPEDKMRKHIFRKDLQSGIDFCVKKYGQTKEAIEAEARRLGVGGF